jgi:hypothetical protein
MVDQRMIGKLWAVKEKFCTRYLLKTLNHFICITAIGETDFSIKQCNSEYSKDGWEFIVSQ